MDDTETLPVGSLVFVETEEAYVALFARKSIDDGIVLGTLRMAAAGVPKLRAQFEALMTAVVRRLIAECYGGEARFDERIETKDPDEFEWRIGGGAKQ